MEQPLKERWWIVGFEPRLWRVDNSGTIVGRLNAVKTSEIPAWLLVAFVQTELFGINLDGSSRSGSNLNGRSCNLYWRNESVAESLRFMKKVTCLVTGERILFCEFTSFLLFFWRRILWIWLYSVTLNLNVYLRFYLNFSIIFWNSFAGVQFPSVFAFDFHPTAVATQCPQFQLRCRWNFLL